MSFAIAYRLVLGVVGQNGKHGSENFFLRDGHLGLHIGEDGRLHVIAFVERGRAPSAHHHSRALLLAFGDVAFHAFALRRRDQRTQARGRIQRIAHLQRADRPAAAKSNASW